MEITKGTSDINYHMEITLSSMFLASKSSIGAELLWPLKSTLKLGGLKNHEERQLFSIEGGL